MSEVVSHPLFQLVDFIDQHVSKLLGTDFLIILVSECGPLVCNFFDDWLSLCVLSSNKTRLREVFI
jgi:hypothetical protein